MLEERKVYEVILVTRNNVTPVGVRRYGDSYNFKLFPGKSFEDLLNHNRASIQFTNDAELLVKLALNWKVDLKLVKEDGWRWLEGFPGVKGYVNYKRVIWSDSLGTTEVLKCSLTPVSHIEGVMPPKPLSRVDCLLLEIGVLYTRFLVSKSLNLARKLREYLNLYFRLGGQSEVAYYIDSMFADKDF